MTSSPPGDGLFPVSAYRRQDSSPDGDFYAYPRKVVHIDNGAIAAVERLYADVLPTQGRLLDLMSSWRSHFPTRPEALEGPGVEIVGLGMNAEEMADNPQLARYVVHDLNHAPTLPFQDEEFDGAMCAVSIQYVLHPLALFREVHRVLRSGAPFVISFSNRCFSTKAVAIWHETDDQQHMALVQQYFQSAGGWDEITLEDRSPAPPGDPLYAIWASKQ